jgi:prephenate dehydrogenase
MKSRIIIWSIVGIIVVLGIIFIATQRRGAEELRTVKPLSDEAYARYIAQMEKQISRFNTRITRIKAKYPNPTPEIQKALEELELAVDEFAKSVENLKGKESKQEREEAYNQTQEAAKKVRRMIRDFGESVTTQESE